MRTPENKQRHYGSALPKSKDPHTGFFYFYRG